MKLAGVARFDCVGSTQEFTCYMAVLASPGDHTCGWTTSALHSHLAWRYWFRWGCGVSSTTSFIADLAGGHIPYPRSTSPDHAAMHPLRRDTPDPSRCTRSEGVQCLRIGCTASHNKHNRGHSLPTHHNRQDQTQPHGLEILAPIPRKRRCTRSVAIHPIRRDTPDQKGCNAYGSGAPPHRQQASSRIWRSTTSPPRVLQAKITQQCTRYDSNALDRRALH